MSGGRMVKAIKVCKICGEGYDAFKARDARGRFCSPACLAEARRRQREDGPLVDETPIGPASLPATITLGHHGAVISLDLLGESEERHLV